jgi:hypothetical protein
MSETPVVETTKNESVSPTAAAEAASVPAVVAEKVKKVKEPKAPRVTLAKQNGVTRPGGGLTGKVWECADRISAAVGAPAPRKQVMEELVAAGVNQATIATQYGRWRKFNGLGKEKAPVADAAAAPAAGGDTTVETPKA